MLQLPSFPPTIIHHHNVSVLFQVLGPRIMENRKPLHLKNALVIYNLFQVIFSSWLFYEVSVSRTAASWSEIRMSISQSQSLDLTRTQSIQFKLPCTHHFAPFLLHGKQQGIRLIFFSKGLLKLIFLLIHSISTHTNKLNTNSCCTTIRTEHKLPQPGTIR